MNTKPHNLRWGDTDQHTYTILSNLSNESSVKGRIDRNESSVIAGGLYKQCGKLSLECGRAFIC